MLSLSLSLSLSLRALLLMTFWLLFTPEAEALPYRLTAADRAEITALVRNFFTATRDGSAEQSAVYPTRSEVQWMFSAQNQRLQTPAGGSVDVATEIVGRHLSAVERDARELRARFHDGVFVRASGVLFERGVIELNRCGRFARPETQCGNGPTLEYTVHGEARRIRIDTLVRLRGRWLIFDARL